jgi:hypothetical protein
LRKYFLFLLVLIASAQARAENYAPGTVGHLYGNCRAALENSTKYTDLQKTYCGAFSEGYFWGALTTNNILAETGPGDPCGAEKEKEYRRINNRFCGNFPKLDSLSVTTGDALLAATGIVTRWIEFEKASSPADPLKRGTLREVNGLVRPGPFCESLKEKRAVREPPFKINPALMKLNLRDFLKAKASMSIETKYERCRKDVAQAQGDPQKFLSTRCGAEISGYISGVYSTRHLQTNRDTPPPQCRKEIDRLYKNLDAENTMCVAYNTNPLWVAEIFLKKYPEIKNTGNGWGGIGNLIIYRGFLCAEKAASSR